MNILLKRCKINYHNSISEWDKCDRSIRFRSEIFSVNNVKYAFITYQTGNEIIILL